MNFEILTTSYFDTEAKKLAKRHRSFVNDLISFQKSIVENPYQGVELAPGIRKIRMAIKSKGRGKSGGVRVITLTFVVSETQGKVVLLLIYDKSDADSVRTDVVKEIVKEIGYDLNSLQISPESNDS